MVTQRNMREIKESEESWTQYEDRLEQYFASNEIKNEKKWRRKGYFTIYYSPRKPGDVDLKEIYENLKNHYSLKPSVIIKRFKFHGRSLLMGKILHSSL